METTYRFIVRVGDTYKNFFKIKETRKGDLIISSRGKHHSPLVGSSAAKSTAVNDSEVTISNITVHPNLKSQIGNITVNYKNNKGGDQERRIAGLFEVKQGYRLFPVITSIGRNIGLPRLNYNETKSHKDRIIELWPGIGIDLDKNSLAYTLVVGNPNIKFIFPEDFPRNVEVVTFKYFTTFLIYWLFNRPTKFRGTTLTISTPEQYVNGFEFHELLNFTNDVTLMNSQVYDNLPGLQKS